MSASTRDRIRKLVIPPAWTDVWIAPDPLLHLQATGRDARGRKQYRYHAKWAAQRDQQKYDHLLPFTDALAAIRRQVSADLRKRPLTREWVLATVVRLLEILETELTVNMKLLGLRTMAELDGTYLQPATPVTAPGPLSALPLL